MKHLTVLAYSSTFLIVACFALLMADASPAAAAPHRPTARVSGTPGVKRLRRVPTFWLQRYRAHNKRYVTNAGVRFAALTPKVYDAKTRKVRSIPFLKRLAKRWYSASLVYFDASKGVAGLWVKKKVGGTANSSTCSCGARYSTLPGSLHRFCRRCGKVATFSFKPPRHRESYYVQVSLQSKRILWTVKLSGTDLYPLGVDSAGKHFMAYRVQRRKKGARTAQKVVLVRVSFSAKKIDWTYTVKLPTRTGLQFSLLATARLFASADLRKVFIREYDERNRAHPKGYLTSPPARGVIVDVGSSSRVALNAPVTSYGTAFGRQNRYLYVTSHQFGRIYKYDTRSGKLVKSVYQGYGAFFLLLSKTGRYLYCVHFTGVNVFDPVTLKRVKSIRLSKLFPGHHKLLAVAKLSVLTSGDFFMGILKKSGRTGRSTAPSGVGFVHFKAME